MRGVFSSRHFIASDACQPDHIQTVASIRLLLCLYYEYLHTFTVADIAWDGEGDAQPVRRERANGTPTTVVKSLLKFTTTSGNENDCQTYVYNKYPRHSSNTDRRGGKNVNYSIVLTLAMKLMHKKLGFVFSVGAIGEGS